MAELYNLARMTTATTGTGTITLGSAVTGFKTFAAAGVSDGEVISYAISDGSNSEAGTGTYTASGTTLTRTVTSSTNSDAAISLSGNAQVFITPRAEDIVPYDGKTATLPAVTTAGAPINIGDPGTSDVPSSPNNGDMWKNNLGVFFREGGVSKQFVFNGSQSQFFQLGVKNPAQTFDYVLKGSAITADRDVTFPLLTANDTFMLENVYQASDRNLRFVDFVLVAPDTDVAVDADLYEWECPFACTIIQDDSNVDYFSAWTDTAGTTGTMVVDIHLNGTTIMTTNKLDIETGETSTRTAATQPDLTTTDVAAGDKFVFAVDAIHTTAAKGLTVRMALRPD